MSCGNLESIRAYTDVFTQSCDFNLRGFVADYSNIARDQFECFVFFGTMNG